MMPLKIQYGVLAMFALQMIVMREHYESSMLSHMGLQIPLLIILGGAFAHMLRVSFPTLEQVGKRYRTSFILFSFFTITIWMLPRLLDTALHDETVATLKWLTLPLSGMSLLLCWKHLPFILRGVLHVELLATLLRLGWLYLIAPQSYCVSYLIDDQQSLGYLLLSYGFVYGLWLGFSIMVKDHRLSEAMGK